MASLDNCGCDNTFNSVMDESPLLNGSQESMFDPMNNNNLNNLNNNNMLSNNMNSMNNLELNQMMNNNGMNMNQNNNGMNMNSNNNGMNEQQIQNIINSIPNKMNNNIELPDNSLSRNIDALNAQNNNKNNQVNNSVANVIVANDQSKYIATMFNYVVVVLLALAINDLVKYFINRSIKFQNGSHNYYIYYTVGLGIVLYIVSKFTNNL